MSLALIGTSPPGGSFQFRIVRRLYNLLQVVSIVKLSDSVLVDRSELRGRAEQEPRISIPVPAVPVSELLAGKSQRIRNSLN